MKSLAVIMPSTRGENAIPSILSVLNQRGLSSIVVIVTGTSCNLKEFRKKCSALSPLVRLGKPYPSDRITPGKARNDGLDILDTKETKPKYLMFVDDDIILPQDYAAKLIAFVETAETPTAAMGRIVSRPESYWNRVLDYSNFWWLQVEHDISDLGWLGAGATLVPFEMVQEIRFSESLMVNEDTDFFRRIADKSKGTLGICSDVTGFHVQGELKLVDLAKKQYWNGCSSLMQFHSHELSFVSLWFGLRNIVAALKKTSAANRSDLMARPMLFAGIFLSFACYEAGIISGISRLRRGNR
jgi:GT2 family glycosyltransferase